ncbi:MAG: type II secretion system F family protein [Deltaproteobacteria bacterium]|nr:type II secretion system F family protein [Deltaproteobacteria bacterium]
MPVYEYKALNSQGKKIEGIINADGLAAARQRLRDGNVYPMEMKEATTRASATEAGSRSLGQFFETVSSRDLSVMTRQFATLLGAGLPVVSSLSALMEQTVHRRLKKDLARIREAVNEGMNIADGMARHPRIFSPLYINMIRAGEATGSLHAALESMADYLEKREALKGKVQAAVAYPLIVFVVALVVLLFLITSVIPKITAMFQEMNQTLPGITILMMAAVSFIKAFWFPLAALAVLLAFLARQAVKKTERGRYFWDRLKLRMPLLGPLVHAMAVGRFSRTLGVLLKNGVPLLSALEIVRNVVNNRLLADAIAEAARDIEEGGSLTASLAKSALMPPVALQLIGAGEQGGALEEMLLKTAEIFEGEVTGKLTIITSLLGPFMILLMGLCVGLIVVSIMLPLFEMNRLIR